MRNACKRFENELTAWLAGDLPVAGWQDLLAHAAMCESCLGRLQAAQAFQAEFGGHPAVDTVPEKILDAMLREVAAPAGLAEARQALDRAFADRGWTPLAFSRIASPFGPLFFAASDRGVVDISFRVRDEGAYRRKLAALAPDIERRDRALGDLAADLKAYFTGRLREFAEPVDLRRLTSAFTRRVLDAARAIPFGSLTTYGELAARVGAPAASRAVGGALGRNPVPIIIPCHRVIAGNGTLGGYTGGLPIKRVLLAIEGTAIPSSTATRSLHA